jgi:hypothetical protein
MANQGPNSCGSEFFVVLASTLRYPGENMIFGEIIKGARVCDAIGNVQTDSEGRPTTPVTIHSVTINRGGVSFDENAQNLPQIIGLSPQMVRSPASMRLGFRQPPGSLAYCRMSPDFEWWTDQKRYLDAKTPAQHKWDLDVDITDQPRYFFATSMVQYSPDAVMPRSLNGKSLSLQMISQDGSFADEAIIHFNRSGGGTANFTTGGETTFTSHQWDATGYGGNLHLVTKGVTETSKIVNGRPTTVSIHFTYTLDARLGLDTSDTTKIDGRNRTNFKVTIGGNTSEKDVAGTFTMSR